MPFQNFGPRHTPAPLKWLLWALFLGPLLSSLIPPLAAILSLSLEGIGVGFVWQLITYPFSAFAPFSFGLLVGLTFVLYLIWTIGGLLIQRIGTAPFLRFFFITAAIAGALTVICSLGLAMPAPISGASPVIYALLIAMLSFGADTNLVLFMMVPFRAKTLVLSLMAFNLLIDVSAQEWTSALSDLFGAAGGYFYALLVWELRGPFVTLHPLEAKIAALGKGVRRLLRLGEPGYGHPAERSPEQEAEDEKFLEIMLSKVAEKGPQSLSFWERWKIRRVSKRRRGG